MATTDFNGDGIDDILWVNRQARSLGIYQMSAAGGFGWVPFGTAPALQPFSFGEEPDAGLISAMPFAIVGDMTGDGASDVLFWDWDSFRGVPRTVVSLVNGVPTSETMSPDGSRNLFDDQERPLNYNDFYRIEGDTDFTGDGVEDLLVLGSPPTDGIGGGFYGGLVLDYEEDGLQGPDTLYLGAFDPYDEIQYAGDFDGDGRDDLLIQNQFTGYIGFLDSGEGFAFRGVGKGSTDRFGNDWHLDGVGDLTNDGHDDIVWYSRNTNGVGAWDMQDGQWTGWIYFGAGGADWHLETVGDYTGDGFDDFLWRHSTNGGVGIWDVTDAAGNWSWIYLGQPSWDWEIVQS